MCTPLSTDVAILLLNHPNNSPDYSIIIEIVQQIGKAGHWGPTVGFKNIKQLGVNATPPWMGC